MSQPASSTRARCRAGGSRDPLFGLSALVVNDIPEVRELFAHFLGRAGMRVTQADGGRAALATARDAAPDLVVTDISMPDMDGLELCRQIRTDPAIGHVPIVIVSGGVTTGDATVWAAGCDAVLEKPCSRDLLVTTARALLSRERRERAAAATPGLRT